VQNQVEVEAASLAELPDDLNGVYQYWQELLNGHPMPSWKQFDLLRIPTQLLPFTLVKDVEYPGPLFRYRFYGTGIARLAGTDQTGMTTQEIRSPSLAAAVNKSLMDYIVDPKPRHYRLHSSFSLDDRPVQIQLRLPLADNGKDLDKIVSILKHHVSEQDYDKALPPKKWSRVRR
jgi:hypothetical protein